MRPDFDRQKTGGSFDPDVENLKRPLNPFSARGALALYQKAHRRLGSSFLRTLGTFRLFRSDRFFLYL